MFACVRSRGAVANFSTAVRKVPGLELIDEEELEGDEKDIRLSAAVLIALRPTKIQPMIGDQCGGGARDGKSGSG
ncbi:hypothetical protein [Bradyrhizobium sp. USDA 4520]